MIEQAELLGPLPASGLYRFAPGKEIARQRQHHRQHMLGHGMHCITADVADNDAPRPADIEVDIVGGGRRNGNHLQLR